MFRIITIFLILCLVQNYVYCAVKIRFPIAGLFNDNTLPTSKEVFFDRVGSADSSSGTRQAYHGRVIYPSVLDTYSTALEVCQNTSDDKGVVALIDARPTQGYCDTVCLLCNRLHINHLALGWQETKTMNKDAFTFSYYPSSAMISKAFATLIKDLGWDRFSLLYEEDDSLVRVQEIIGSWSHRKEPITYRRLIPNGDNRETFKYIFKVARLSHHVIDCAIENLPYYMKEIVQVENATQYQSFILTNLDSHTVKLQEVDSSMHANISTLYMTTIDPTRWKDIGIKSTNDMKMETALAVDALSHLEKAIRVMQQEISQTDAERYSPKELYGEVPAMCFKSYQSSYEPWAWGEKLREALLQTKTEGFTGSIAFDSNGRRTNFSLNYAKRTPEKRFEYAGRWDSLTDILQKEEGVQDISQSQTSEKIRVISRNELPYFNIRIDENGNEHYRGYAVDLASEIIAKINEEHKLNLKVQFKEVPDKAYGNPIEGSNNKKWNGIIGELMSHNADMGICDLTITSDRNSVVDFSTPFMNTGISMLFRERDPEDPDMFSFINPLSLDVWLYLATSYIVVSYVLLLCARMTQADWVNPHPCNQNPEKLQNIWSLYNCMWLAMGTIMTQGCDILPRGLGSRWITGMWWFFAMIVTASYTANMSTFLSNSRRSNDIQNAKELSEQNEVSYGAVYNASTYRFFEHSNDTVYQKLWQVMKTTKPTVFTQSNEEGKDRVLRSKGNYAFFMESTAIKYYAERNCKLKMVGPPLDSKSYGIAMPKNFPYKQKVDRAILQLQESGRLSELEDQWWKKEDNDVGCDSEEKEEEEDDGSLQMKNTSGIFLVLGVGGVLGLFVAIIDFMMHANKIAVKEKLTFKEALISEWRASFNVRTLAKPAAPLRSAPPSSGSPSPSRERSKSRAVSVLRAASSFINFDEIY